MKIRCDLHLNGGARKLLLVPGINETGEHLALKLAAYLLFWDQEPVVAPGAKHPALAGQEFLPDLMALDEGGGIKLWVEAGATTAHKLGKLVRRLTYGRIVVLTATEREGERLRADTLDRIEKGSRVEVLAFPGRLFLEWAGCVLEKTEVFGEASGHMLNLVVNEHPLVAELKVC